MIYHRLYQEDQLFEDSEDLFNIQSFNIKPERVTERGLKKLYPPIEVMDVRLGRSIINSFISISLSINNEHESSHLPASASLPSLMEFKCGRSIIDSFKSFKYLISLLIRNSRMQNHLIQLNLNLEDLFISNNTSIIPFITNEEYQKLFESILIVDNLGRFFNSNPPP